MTLHIGTARAAALSAAGEENNPIFAWDNIGATGTLSSTPSAQSDFPEANAFDGLTYDFCKITVSGSVALLRTDLGSAQSINFCGVAAHNIGTLGGSMRPQYSTDGGSTWNPCDGISAQVVADDGTIGFYFDDISAQDWRLNCSNLSASDEATLGVVFFGNVVTMPQRIYQGYTPPITPTEVTMVPEVSEGGEFLGSTVIRRGSRTSAQFTDVSPTFFRGSDWKPFQRAWNNGTPAFWAWRPTKYAGNHDVHYAWSDGRPIVPENSGPLDLMSADVSMRIYHEDWT